jgi:two-component system, LytTR family, sensor histidine kinase AlgZ
MEIWTPETDAFGFEILMPRRWHVGIVILRTLIIDQLIAVPVALVLTSAAGEFWWMVFIATVYSQVIGLSCALTSLLTIRWLDAQPPWRGQAGIMAQYFACGVAGAEIARRICASVIGPNFNAGPPFVSWAIGATIALLVGGVMMTMRQLRGKVLSTELEALQARINPHFLFNTLNSIAALIREDPARAENMTLQLSALFRYTLQAPRSGLVTLGEELIIVQGYLAIEQERLGARLTSGIDVDEALHNQRIPALTLQPLVENAIKHGIAPGVAGGSVRVRGWREGDLVHVTVVNTGSGQTQSAGTGEGLENVRRRLRATFGARSSVTLRTAPDATEARVTFPAGTA